MTTERRLKHEIKEQAMRKSIVAVLAALAASGLVAPAAAEEHSVIVSYADLNVATPAGAHALDRRIAAAVEKVCAKPELRDLKGMTAWEECKAAALADALAQLSSLEPVDGVALASLV